MSPSFRERFDQLINIADTKFLAALELLGYDMQSLLFKGVEIGSTQTVREVLEKHATMVDPSVRSNAFLKHACEHGFTGVAELLLSDQRVNPRASYDEPIARAASRGHVEIVKLLLEHPKINAMSAFSAAMEGAVNNNQSHVIEYLLDTCHDMVNNFASVVNDELIHAIERQKRDAVRLLLPYSDPTLNSNMAIRCAAQTGNADIVRILMSDKRVDPTADGNFALQMAHEFRNQDMVTVLMSDSRVNPDKMEELLGKMVITPSQT